jgi:hypothetical protein
MVMWVLVNNAVQDQLSHVHHHADMQGLLNFRYAQVESVALLTLMPNLL